MANRNFQQYSLTLEKQVVKLFAYVTFGATGAPTLVVAQSKGIKSVTRNSAGKYTFVFGNANNATQPLDTYKALLDTHVLFDATANSGTAPAAPLMYLTGNSINTVGTASIQLQMTNLSAVATDPANTEAAYFEFTFKNSSAY